VSIFPNPGRIGHLPEDFRNCQTHLWPCFEPKLRDIAIDPLWVAPTFEKAFNDPVSYEPRPVLTLKSTMYVSTGAVVMTGTVIERI
jgi:hypothetical protein